MPRSESDNSNSDPRDEIPSENKPIDFTDIENEPGQCGGPPPDIRTKAN